MFCSNYFQPVPIFILYFLQKFGHHVYRTVFISSWPICASPDDALPVVSGYLNITIRTSSINQAIKTSPIFYTWKLNLVIKMLEKLSNLDHHHLYLFICTTLWHAVYPVQGFRHFALIILKITYLHEKVSFLCINNFNYHVVFKTLNCAYQLRKSFVCNKFCNFLSNY